MKTRSYSDKKNVCRERSTSSALTNFRFLYISFNQIPPKPHKTDGRTKRRGEIALWKLLLLQAHPSLYGTRSSPSILRFFLFYYFSSFYFKIAMNSSLFFFPFFSLFYLYISPLHLNLQRKLVQIIICSVYYIINKP